MALPVASCGALSGIATLPNPPSVYSGCTKTYRYSIVFFYNHLYRNSLFRNIIMKSGITSYAAVHLAFHPCSKLQGIQAKAVKLSVLFRTYVL